MAAADRVREVRQLAKLMGRELNPSLLLEPEPIRVQCEQVWSRITHHHLRGATYMVFVLPSGNPVEQCLSEAAAFERQLHLAEDEETANRCIAALEELIERTARILAAGGNPVAGTGMARLLQLLCGSYREFMPAHHLIIGSNDGIEQELSDRLKTHSPLVLHVTGDLTPPGTPDELVIPAELELLRAVCGGPLGACEPDEVMQRPVLAVLAMSNSAQLACWMMMCGIPCAIGWNGYVNPSALDFFMACFYKSLELVNNSSVAKAFMTAKDQTFNKHRWSFGSNIEAGESSTPVIMTLNSKGQVAAFSESHPDGLIMPITRALPAGISVEKFVDPLLGVLPFLGTMARGADNARLQRELGPASQTEQIISMWADEHPQSPPQSPKIPQSAPQSPNNTEASSNTEKALR